MIKVITQSKFMKSKIIATFFAALVAFSAKAPSVQAGEVFAKAIAEPIDDSSFYIYADIWAIGIKGDIGAKGMTNSIDVGFDDILDNLDATVAGGFGYQKGKWGFLTEFVWLKVSTDAPTPGALFSRVDLGVEQFIADGHISYRIFECRQGKGYIDLIGGARYMYVKNTLDFLPGAAPHQKNFDGSKSWWDAYGGLKGRYNITDKWFVPFRGDAGGGGSSIAWQAMAGIGYQFNPTFDMKLAYRYMAIDYSDGGFLFDVATSGPIVTLGFTF